MIYLVCAIVGGMAGAAACYALMRRMHAIRTAPVALDGVRWERSGGGTLPGAVRHMRRYYPTHELIIGCPFSDLVVARGASSEAVARRCGGWTVGVCMVDRRTGSMGRIVLWACDVDAEEKSWILRRAGYRVTIVERHVEESVLVEAMAA